MKKYSIAGYRFVLASAFLALSVPSQAFAASYVNGSFDAGLNARQFTQRPDLLQVSPKYDARAFSAVPNVALVQPEYQPDIHPTGITAVDYAINAVSFSELPEPATWALLLVGFATIGSVIRRRRVRSISFS